jgi:hypothetical protein
VGLEHRHRVGGPPGHFESGERAAGIVGVAPAVVGDRVDPVAERSVGVVTHHQGQRFEEALSEPHVRPPASAGVGVGRQPGDHEHQVVEVGGVAVVGVGPHVAVPALDLEAEIEEHELQGGVLMQAVAGPTDLADPLEAGGGVDRRRRAEHDAEVLVGHRRLVPPMDQPQRIERRREGTVDAESAEVGADHSSSSP